MRTVTRTVYGAAMQTAKFLGIPYEPVENSTLNERFDILANTAPSQDEEPYVAYYVIGNGGHQHISGASGVPYTMPRNHAATDAACFNHIPFVLRELDNDLSAVERQNYALRTIETIDGVEYAAYYAKRLNLENVEVTMQKVTIDNGSQEEETFEPTNENLNPEPYDHDDEALIESSGEYVSGFAILTINFSANDAEELRNVAKIMYGDENYAIISEIALVSGVDRERMVVGEGGTEFSFNDVIAAQIVSFIATYYQLNMQNEGFTFTSNVGIAEPLFAVQDDG